MFQLLDHNTQIPTYYFLLKITDVKATTETAKSKKKLVKMS